jgi:hypothetical protein
MNRTVLLSIITSLTIGACAGLAYARFQWVPSVVSFLCQSKELDKSVVARNSMNLIASGRAEYLYSVLENSALECVNDKHAEDSSLAPYQIHGDCIKDMKIFYKHHPDRVAELQHRFPNKARLLDLVPSK